MFLFKAIFSEAFRRPSLSLTVLRMHYCLEWVQRRPHDEQRGGGHPDKAAQRVVLVLSGRPTFRGQVVGGDVDRQQHEHPCAIIKRALICGVCPEPVLVTDRL